MEGSSCPSQGQGECACHPNTGPWGIPTNDTDCRAVWLRSRRVACGPSGRSPCWVREGLLPRTGTVLKRVVAPPAVLRPRSGPEGAWWLRSAADPSELSGLLVHLSQQWDPRCVSSSIGRAAPLVTVGSRDLGQGHLGRPLYPASDTERASCLALPVQHILRNSDSAVGALSPRSEAELREGG